MTGPQADEKSVTAYLGLGSNLGDREANLRKALSLLSRHMQLVVVSSIYETEPWGYLAQPKFLNMACGVHTRLEPTELLGVLKQVEAQTGRTPTFRNGPRVIDIDILLYGDLVIESDSLVVPQRSIAKRPFTLVPLNEIAGDMVHPVLGASIRQLLASSPGKEGVCLWGPPPALQDGRLAA